MPNRLADQTSPYLLQHKDNPVDWFPWGAEAFEKAKVEDKPVFLSVGYSSCHWCHVMEHESFEDESVAEILNRDFVSIKVDREELPHVDETYMVAVQLSAGRGGWPMSVFCTPDRLPFFAGTYFPKEDRGNHSGFISVLQQIAIAWKSDRQKVEEVASGFAEAIRQSRESELEPAREIGAQMLDECVRSLSMDFDEELGGFGKAPKFPPHTGIEFLLNYAISDFGDEELRQSAADMALFTLEKMALGGIRDHVGGGFHRYSTDERWLLPHFEKMLYDNALLLGNYARAAALCHEHLPELEQLFSQAVDGIVGWLKGEMTSGEGLFYSAQDADSEGEEGKFYVWTRAELDAALGKRAEHFAAAYQFHPQGNFRDEASGEPTGANVPHLLEILEEPLDAELSQLRDVRGKRVKPALDDKALVGWNGLMIAALCEAAEIGMAERAAEAILAAERSHGRLPRQISKAGPSGEGYLEDYAYFVYGLTALASVKALFVESGAASDGRDPGDIFDDAKRLAQQMVERFGSDRGFFDTSDAHESLFGRSKPAFDQPLPSANAVAAKCLMELGDSEKAWQTVRSFSGWMERAPLATESLHLALLELLTSHQMSEPEVDAVSRQVSVRLLEDRLMALNGTAEGTIEIQVPAELHINSSHPPANWLVPTSVSTQPLLAKVHFPDAEGDRYEGLVHIPFAVELPPGIGAQDLEITVRWQACSETECQLPEERTLTCLVQAT